VLVAYLTTDEVNEDLALRMAAECGITLRPLALQGAPPDGEFDAVVYDWDYLPADHRKAILSNLLSGFTPYRVVLHGYHLEDDQVEALRANGVLVHRRLDLEVFEGLRGAPVRVRSAAHSALKKKSSA
jgi:hypothetical protein